MSRTDTLDLIHKAMFDPIAEAQLSQQDMLILTRLKDGYAYWLNKPLCSDKQIRDYLCANYNISKMQALRDIANIKNLLGDVKNASVEFYRYKINDLLDRAANAAMNGDATKAKALAKVADIMVRNNRTNIADEEKPDFSGVVIPDFSFSINPIHAGVKITPGAVAKAKKLRKQLLGDDIEDIDYEQT